MISHEEIDTYENGGEALISTSAEAPTVVDENPQTTLASVAAAATKAVKSVERDSKNDDDKDPFLDTDGPADGNKMSRKTKIALKVKVKEAIFQDLLAYGLDEKGKLPHGRLSRVARKFNTTFDTVNRIWKRGYVEKRPLMDYRSMNKGVKQKYNEEELKMRLEVATRSGGEGAHHLRSLRDSAKMLGLPSSTCFRYLHKWKKEKEKEKKQKDNGYVEGEEPKTALARDNCNAVINVLHKKDEDPTNGIVLPVYKKMPKSNEDSNHHRYVFTNENETNDDDNDGNHDIENIENNDEVMESEEEELPPIRPGPSTKKLIQEKGVMKFCIFCGQKIVIVAKFCSNCGGEQITPATLKRRITVKETKSQAKKKKVGPASA